ncbi:MAG: hypothetical protein Ct9H300mP29_7870 [Candidatus Neomarinimicrobiota bacterium]|nr:MAG: hypothetical protein Ct9H300mP29_7870 [Candidatus Neomarinimicrobiota bacterium]
MGGGVKLHNAKEVMDAGADVLVAGSEVFKSADPVQTIKGNFFIFQFNKVIKIEYY